MITQVLVQTLTTREKTTNSIMITQVLVQTYTTRENNNGATNPVSQLEQGGTWHH